MTEPIVLTDDTPTAPKTEVKSAPRTNKVLDAILDRIAPVHVNTPTLKVLIYGEAGTGKTTFAGTSPSPLVIDVERGSRALLNVNNPVDVLEFKSIEQVEATIAYLKQGHEAFEKYDTIVLDSITEMQARLIDQQLRQLGAGAPVYKADWGVYGENTQRLRMLISSFRDIEKNLICTAHARTEKDDQTGITFVRPDLTPGLNKTVAGIFDIVGYLRINAKGERVLRVQPSKTVKAKSRLSLPDEITMPTWASIAKDN